MRALAAAAWALLGTAVLAQAPSSSPPIVPEPLAVQIMLDRSGFSPGEIDGRPGMNMQRAIAAFQATYKLPATGRIDAALWERLSARGGGQPPLVSYEITDADVAGPFAPDIPSDLMQQAALPALAYHDPIEALAEKFHSSPQLLRTLNPGAAFASGDRLFVPNIAAIDPLTPVPGTRRAGTIVVSKATSALTIEDEHGQT